LIDKKQATNGHNQSFERTEKAPPLNLVVIFLNQDKDIKKWI